jgi:thiol-disulfide isomerase/thioredoxin
MHQPLSLALPTILVLAGSLALGNSPPTQPNTSPVAERKHRPAPSWQNQSWLNTSAPLKLEALKGKVVLLNFWVFTCYNCTNTVPSLVDFDRRYRDKGLVIIGIHTPEFPPYAGEHDKANVARALKQYRIEYPNAQDNDSRTWKLYGIRYWPSFVLIDKKGDIRYEGAGEFHLNDRKYQSWDRRIQELLSE